MLHGQLSKSSSTEFHGFDLGNVTLRTTEMGGAEIHIDRCSSVNGVDDEQTAVVHDDVMRLRACPHGGGTMCLPLSYSFCTFYAT